MITKQEYLLSIPFDYIIGFSKETKLIRDNGCFTKKDFIHRLMSNLEIAQCKQLYEEYNNGFGYKYSVKRFLTEFPTGQIIGQSFVAEQISCKPNSFFLEFPISKTRVDILQLSNNFHAYEIKSQRDNFNRLHYQVPALRAYFENVSLIVPMDSWGQIAQKIDEKVGIITFSSECGSFSFEVVRPASQIEEYESMAQLDILQISELRGILSNKVEPVFDKKVNRKYIIQQIVNTFTRTEINELFKLALQNRGQFQNQRSLLNGCA